MLILKQIYYIPNSRTTNKSKATNLNEQTQIFKYENEILPRIFDIPNNNMYAHNTSLWVSLTTESKEKKINYFGSLWSSSGLYSTYSADKHFGFFSLDFESSLEVVFYRFFASSEKEKKHLFAVFHWENIFGVERLCGTQNKSYEGYLTVKKLFVVSLVNRIFSF